jgi:hypothetical protein
MENKRNMEQVSKRKDFILKVYIVILGIFSLTILSLTILAFALGISALAMPLFQSIYYALFSLMTHSSNELVYWNNPSLLFTLTSLFLLWVISISMVGAVNKKRWGHTVNIIFLGIIFPLFFTLPAAGLGFVPHAADIIPFALVCPLFLFLFVFDIFYLFWFMKNRYLFVS